MAKKEEAILLGYDGTRSTVSPASETWSEEELLSLLNTKKLQRIEIAKETVMVIDKLGRLRKGAEKKINTAASQVLTATFEEDQKNLKSIDNLKRISKKYFKQYFHGFSSMDVIGNALITSKRALGNEQQNNNTIFGWM